MSRTNRTSNDGKTLVASAQALRFFSKQKRDELEKRKDEVGKTGRLAPFRYGFWMKLVSAIGFCGCLIGCHQPDSPSDVGSTQAPTAIATEPIGQSFDEAFDAVLNGQSRQLLIEATPVSADQLRQLSELPMLLTLQLDGGLVDANNLFELPLLPELTQFRLRLTAINQRGLEHLSNSCPKIQVLNVPVLKLASETSTPDLFSGFKAISSLRIGGPSVDGNIINSVRQLAKLRHLHLISPSIQDSDLQVIATIKSLRSFYLDDCPLSQKAWEDFFKSRPDIHVHLDQLHADWDPNRH